jgi:hypothetical protein
MKKFTFLSNKRKQYSLLDINIIGYYTIEEMIHLLKDEFINVNVKEKMDVIGKESVIVEDSDIIEYLDDQYRSSLNSNAFNPVFCENPKDEVPNFVNILRNVELVLENNDEGELVEVNQDKFEILLNETDDELVGGEVMVHQSNGVNFFVGLNVDGGYYFERFRGINRHN